MRYLELFKNQCENLYDKKEETKRKIVVDFFTENIVDITINGTTITNGIVETAFLEANGCPYLTTIYIAQQIAKDKYAYVSKIILDKKIEQLFPILEKEEFTYKKELQKIEEHFIHTFT